MRKPLRDKQFESSLAHTMQKAEHFYAAACTSQDLYRKSSPEVIQCRGVCIHLFIYI